MKGCNIIYSIDSHGGRSRNRVVCVFCPIMIIRYNSESLIAAQTLFEICQALAQRELEAIIEEA